MRRASYTLLAAAVVSLGGLAAWGEETPEKKPPVVEYSGSSRSSSDWVELPGGSRVAVDKGAAWQGVKVYLSMTWQLVGVDVETGKTLWGTGVGAFWNAFTFKEVTPRDGGKRWAVELRPGSRGREHAGKRQYHDLRTGTKLEVPGLDQTPSGVRFDVRVTFRGDKSDIAKRYRVFITTPESWTAFRKRAFSDVDPQSFSKIDWKNEVVFALSAGNSGNCSGYRAVDAYEDYDRVLLRLRRIAFQTMNGYQKTRPWACVVLPRRAKAYEVEIDSQGLIGGPPLWKRIHAIERLPDPRSELAALPPKSDEPHHGWAADDAESLRPPPPSPKKPR